MSDKDTIVALSTAAAAGAIAVVRLSGSESLQILRTLSKKSKKDFIKARYATYLSIWDNDHKLDEVIALWMPGPKSFSGEDIVEIHCHGSSFIVRRIIELCIENGARQAQAGEFTKRAFLNGKIDLSQAEAICDLIAAEDELTARSAFSQLDAYLSRLIETLKKQFLDILCLLEAGFDFVEEDVQLFDKEEALKKLSFVEVEIQNLLDSFQTAKLYKEGFKIALVGKPNVGKSSFLNALLKEDRAIIHHEAGTTRDVIEGERLIDGIKFFFYDTAGIRQTNNSIEKEGIMRSQKKIDQADAVVLLCDGSKDLDEDDRKLINELSHRENVIYLRTKSDLPSSEWGPDIKIDFLSLSSKSYEGFDKFFEVCLNFINNTKYYEHNYVLNNRRHKVRLEDVYLKIKDLKDQIQSNNFSEEILAEDLKAICNGLSEITGEIGSEEILDEIFSNFCIGK